MAESATAVLPPPRETGAAPAELAPAEPHLFGVTPPLALLVLAATALAAGVVLVAVGERAVGIALVVVGLLLLVAFAAVARRLRRGRVASRAAHAVDTVRGRAGALATSVGAKAEARRRLAALSREADDLRRERRSLLEALGGAVYDGDAGETASLRARVAGVDEALGAKEAEMAAVATQARERVRRARLEAQATEMVEVPSQPSEPYPPPGEATPPEPARIPEPYPPPDEGSPAEPVRIPEPEPPTEQP